MGRHYNIQLPRTVVTAALDLAELVTASSHVCLIHTIELSQSTELGDAQEEMLQLSWKMGQTASGSLGINPVIPIPLLPGDAAAGMTGVRAFNTQKASAGSITTYHTWDWNLRVPFEKIFTPERRLTIPPSTRATLELVSAPSDSVTISGQLGIEIIG